MSPQTGNEARRKSQDTVPSKVIRAGFRPRARMVEILGEHLIRDNTVGLMELIKNGYDADATRVDVQLLDVRDAESTAVIVKDNGIGMTEEVLLGPWFEPAHGGKEEEKRDEHKTALGRIPLGEKGVGRFAAQKLGRRLELVTRAKGSDHELCLSVDWDEFDDPSKYLDEIRLEIKRRVPEIFTASRSSGTFLRMTEAREPWQRSDLERFQASLLRLLSPRTGVKNFSVTLKCPDFPEIESLDASDIIEKYHFRIDCFIDRNGIARYEFRSRAADGKEGHTKQECNLWSQANPDTWQDRPPSCGPFLVQICAWLNKAKLLDQYGLNKSQLKAIGGVSIYRDGFRILPYGDEGDDWLGLDVRRINDPSTRFGNRQVIGIVEIDQVHNRELIDKTNREGLRENQAYRDLKELVLGVVQKLEQESLSERHEVTKTGPDRKQLETTIRNLEEKVKQLESRPAASAEQESGVVPQPEKEEVLVKKQELEELRETVKVIHESVTEVYDSREDERETFLHLLGIGLAAERFIHEFDRLVAAFGDTVKSLKGSVDSGAGREHLERLDLYAHALRNELRLIGTLKFIRRSERAEDTSVREIVEMVLPAYDEDIKRAGIRIDPRLASDFAVHISRASLGQVIDNLVHNGIYWLKQKSEREDRRLRIELDAKDRSILISNNGPAILPNVRPMLFRRPFVTHKPEGRGLGMYITSEILKRYGGIIRIIDLGDDKRVLEGAAFQITFPEKR